MNRLEKHSYACSFIRNHRESYEFHRNSGVQRCAAEQSGEYAEDLAATMLATTLGIEFDPNKGWDKRDGIYKMSHKIINC